MKIQENFKLILADRGYLTALVVLLVIAFGIIVMGAANIRPSELQIPVRYTSFGITNFYRDRWYYLLSLVLFAVVIAVMHTLVSVRLYTAKGRGLAVSFVWLSVIVLIIASVFIFAIFRVASLSQ